MPKGIAKFVRILFDHNVPVGLRAHLSGHEVSTAAEHGWGEMTNGRLLAAAEASGVDLMVTCDRNLAHQQKLAGKKLSLVVLSSPAWPVVRENLPAVVAAVSRSSAGSYEDVVFARPPLRRRPFWPVG
jgi:predicted nuclease of predicted toxin-antitoxin system